MSVKKRNAKALPAKPTNKELAEMKRIIKRNIDQAKQDFNVAENRFEAAEAEFECQKEFFEDASDVLDDAEWDLEVFNELVADAKETGDWEEVKSWTPEVDVGYFFINIK